MKQLLLSCLVLLLSLPGFSQKYYTRDAQVQFFSATPVENIEALNKNGTAVLDSETGNMQLKVLIKSFMFEKALMQEHFNENYMESNKFPSAVFKGTLVNFDKSLLKKEGKHPVTAKGTLEIHGVKKQVNIPGTITVKGGAISVASEFLVACADYDIKIPAVVRDNIAKEIKVSLKAGLEEMK
ncbi:MAG: YceI family protein [Saprospiraceae bacterium]